jgi:hypothetical protein
VLRDRTWTDEPHWDMRTSPGELAPRCTQPVHSGRLGPARGFPYHWYQLPDYWRCAQERVDLETGAGQCWSQRWERAVVRGQGAGQVRSGCARHGAGHGINSGDSLAIGSEAGRPRQVCCTHVGLSTPRQTFLVLVLALGQWENRFLDSK